MRSPGGGKGGSPTGPRLTRAEEEARDRREAQKAEHEAGKAGREAAKAEHEARKEEAEARRDRKHGERKDARAADARAVRDRARARRDLARSGRDSARSERESERAAGLSRACAPSAWIAGGNNWHQGCAAVAIANSLLAATGVRASTREILRLHAAAAGSPGRGASVPAVLGALSARGLAGRFPAVIAPAQPGDGGAVALLALEAAQQDQDAWDDEPSPAWGWHGVLLEDGAAVTWGREVAVTSAFLARQARGAWRITWEATAWSGKPADHRCCATARSACRTTPAPLPDRRR